MDTLIQLHLKGVYNNVSCITMLTVEALSISEKYCHIEDDHIVYEHSSLLKRHVNKYTHPLAHSSCECNVITVFETSHQNASQNNLQ